MWLKRTPLKRHHEVNHVMRHGDYVLHYIYTAACCSVAVHCNLLQCVAACCSGLIASCVMPCRFRATLHCVAVCCIVLQCVVVCCSALTSSCVMPIMYYAAACCSVAVIATHCKTLHHTATHCNTMQHTITFTCYAAECCSV